EHEDTTADDPMGRALVGGETGVETTLWFLYDLPRLLASDGVGLVVTSSLADHDAVETRARANGFDTRVVAEDRFFFEVLRVLALEP
ncbi:MAG: methyltransferase, partial [Halobacteriota archaeon]